MGENQTREWITLREVQEILGFGSTKAYELVALGEIPAIRVGRAIRVSVNGLERWVERQTYTDRN